MNLSLSDKNALVCGSSQGIGKAVAMELAGLGANVVLFARNADKLADVCQSLPRNNKQSHTYITADFADPEQVKVAIETYLEESGLPLHILVNNTGGPAAGPISEATVAALEAAFHAHLINNHVLATALLPGMTKDGYGRIINIISTSVKAPLPNLGVSNTIRGAVANWSKTLANEVGKLGITVNNVLPGATETERLSSIISNKAAQSGRDEQSVSKDMLREIPLHRFGKAEEIAAAVAFLASPAGAYINGINLPVDGGRTASL